MTNERRKITKSYFVTLSFSLIPFFIITSFLYHLSISQHIHKLRSEHEIILELIKKDLENDFSAYIEDVNFLAKSPQLKSLLYRKSNLQENKAYLESYLKIKDRYIAGDMKNNRNHIIIKEYYGLEALNINKSYAYTPNKKLTLNLIPRSDKKDDEILSVTAPIFHNNNEILGSISLYSLQNSVFSILKKYKSTNLISKGDFFWFKANNKSEISKSENYNFLSFIKFLPLSSKNGFLFQKNNLFIYNTIDFQKLLPDLNFGKDFSTLWRLVIVVPSQEIISIKKALLKSYLWFNGFVFIFYSIGLWFFLKEFFVRKFYEDKLKSQNLQLLDSNRSKDRFISILAHDLKSPFTGITGIFTMLTKKYDSYSEDKKKSLIFSLNNSVQGIHSLLINLLEWSRLEGGYIAYSPQKIKLNNLITTVNQVLNLNLERKHIKIFNTTTDLIFIWADKNMVEAIFRNIISNAIKFTPEHGKIEISSIKEEKFINIYIKDSGIGMSKEIQSKLFSLNQRLTTLGTNNEKGTGLGLLITKEFINLNKGTLEIHSIIGRGTTFIIKLPIYQEIL